MKKKKSECIKCRILHKKGVRVAMGPVGENNLTVAPPFYLCQADICGPFESLASSFLLYCNRCGGVESWKTTPQMHSIDSHVYLVTLKLLCHMNVANLRKAVKSVVYGIDFKTCPMGAHYVHGKVKRKIQEIKRSLMKNVNKNRLSVLQWETLIQQICNSINNIRGKH